MNELTGAAHGYFQKVLGPRPIRRIGLKSLDWVYAGLGVKAVLIDDPQALELVQKRYTARDRAHTASAKARWESAARHTAEAQ